MGKWRFYFESFISVYRNWFKSRKSRGKTQKGSKSEKFGQTASGRNCTIIDYEVYEFSREEFIWNVSIGILVFFGVSYLFYESILISFLFTPFSIFYVKKQKQKKIAERKWKLNLQFKEGLIALLGALNAGYSIENGFVAALKDLRLIYEKEEPIIKEFEGIVAGIQINQNVESLLMDLADRSGVEDIEVFAEVFSVCKRTGGDLIMVISAALENISDRIEVKRQIKTLTAAKKLEAKIMSFVPLGIIAYMKLFSGGLLEPLYGNLLGRFIMTGMLTGYLAAYEMSRKIVEIEM